LPHIRHNAAPVGEYFPQAGQSSGGAASPITTTCEDFEVSSFMKAHTSAITQPTTVHPRKRFNQKIAPAFLFDEAMMLGRKYSARSTKTRTDASAIIGAGFYARLALSGELNY
jgi:hypothetical protein